MLDSNQPHVVLKLLTDTRLVLRPILLRLPNIYDTLTPFSACENRIELHLLFNRHPQALRPSLICTYPARDLLTSLLFYSWLAGV